MTAADFEKMATSAGHQAPGPGMCTKHSDSFKDESWLALTCPGEAFSDHIAVVNGVHPIWATKNRTGHRDDDFLERSFWSSVTINPPLYGADTPVSFFDERLDYGWNLRRLGCLLSEFDVPEIPGVTTPMAYFGSWKSFFGWHKEDIDLYSINYNHAGAAKIWYCVSPKDGAKFDSMARGLFPELHAACPAFVRHKDILISPRLLRAAGVPFVQARQEPGEFIVLNAAAYHSGFNLGFNIAEAVNFALPAWLEIGRQAVNCECDAMPDGVCLDMGIFFPDLRVSEDESSDSDDEEERNGGNATTSDEDESGSESSCTAPHTDRAVQRKKGRRRESSKTAVRGRTSASKSQRESPSSSAQTARKRRRLTASMSDEQESDSSTATEVTVPQRHRKRKPVSPTTKKSEARQRPVTVPAVQKGGGVRTGRSRVPAGALHVAWGAVAEERPVALVERASEGPRAPFYTLVHRLAKTAGKPGAIWVGLLKEGTDGLFRYDCVTEKG